MSTSNNWTNTRSPATMRNAERLVKIEVRNICTEFSRLRYTNECVEIGSININLSASVVNHFADLGDSFFKYSVSRWVGNHERRKCAAVLPYLLLQIIKADISSIVTCNNNNLHTSHNCARCICSVCTGWNQANSSVLLTAGIEIATNGK